MTAGSELHYRHGRKALELSCMRTLAYILAAGGISHYCHLFHLPALLKGWSSRVFDKIGSGATDILYLAAAFFLVAILLFWQAKRGQKAFGLPAGRVIYADMRAWGPVEQPLYDAELALVGKPDYLIENSGQYIPVEVKSPVSPMPLTTLIYFSWLPIACWYNASLANDRHMGS